MWPADTSDLRMDLNNIGVIQQADDHNGWCRLMLSRKPHNPTSQNRHAPPPGVDDARSLRLTSYAEIRAKPN